MLDVSDFKKTKDELLKSQELINSVFHTADIGIALVDGNGKYVKTNDGYNKIFGFEKGGLDGMNYSVSMIQADKKHSKERLAGYFSGKRDEAIRTVLRKNGELIYVYRTVNLIKNSDGSKYLVVTARDISETKKYQQLLQNTEQVARVAGWEMNGITYELTCTDEMYNIIEYSRAGFDKLNFDKKVNKFVDISMRTEIKTAIEHAIENGKPFQMEFPLITGTKKRKWVEMTCSADRFKSKTVKLSGTLHDISLKKEAELELERLSLVASKTNNAVFITDKYGKTEWINSAVTNMTGFTLKELLGKTPGQVLQGKETDQGTVSRIRARLQKRLPVKEIIKNYRKDGSKFWINMDIAPVFKNNALINFIGVGVDVTELIKAKEEQKIKDLLEQQQKLFNAIAKNFPDGIIGVLDDKFHYVFVGGAEIKKLGLTQKNFIGNKIFDHISEKSNISSLPFLKRALAGEAVNFEVEMKEDIYAVNAVPLMDTNRKPLQILIVLYNITLSKRAENDLRETLKKEKELGDLKSRFVSMASHEFRTPLSTVLSSAYLIDKYTSTEDQPQRQKHLQRIVSSVEMLTEILNDFLSLGKMEEGKLQVKYSQFNIDDTVQALTREIKNNLKKDQKIVYQHQGKPEVMLDISLLKHIVMNLISNASKFSPEGSPIEVNTVNNSRSISLSVKDHGMGISKDDQQHLMERFFRGSNAANIQGTGLGLNIVSKYAELMNGTIECISELEKGTEFIIRFKTKTS
jgi:PAS domain S-box-containing protein